MAKLKVLTQLSKNMTIIKNFDVDTSQIKNFSNIEEIDNYLISVMQKKCQESIEKFETHEYKRK